MRVLDIDLDFFVHKAAYSPSRRGEGMGAENSPWSARKVQLFLEDKCGLRRRAPLPGRIVESHDEVLGFWRELINSGRLKVPFDVVHIDAHPDMCMVEGIYEKERFLYVDLERCAGLLEKKQVHAGNYLTFAIVYGWVGLLSWVIPGGTLKRLPAWNGDAACVLRQYKRTGNESASKESTSAVKSRRVIPYRIIYWRWFQYREPFDYIVLSKSASSTPPESAGLIPVIQEYMKQI